jgi:hypothetical protein
MTAMYIISDVTNSNYFPSSQTVPYTPPKQSSSTPDQPPQFEDQSQADDGTTKCVARDGGWRNAAIHGIVVRRWIAIRFL